MWFIFKNDSTRCKKATLTKQLKRPFIVTQLFSQKLSKTDKGINISKMKNKEY